LPDLYDSDYGGSGGESDGIGKWGAMASGSWNGGGNSPAHFCAWSKIELGWVEPQIVTSDISLFRIEIPPVWNNTVIYKIWAHDPSQDTTEYFLVENRQKSGYDTQLPGDGILIWHINESALANRNPDRLMVDLEEADGNEELITYGGAKGEAQDPWKNSVTGFTYTSTPNSTSYNTSDTFVWVWNISGIAGDGNMSLGFKEVYSGPTGISISDPVSNTTIKDVYDFILNDTYFPDEDVGRDNEGNNGSYVLEYRKNNTSDPFMSVSPQVPKEWVGGVKGIINCTALPEGFWDFRVKILDEEGHLLYTPIVINIAVPTNIPPIADAGPDNLTDVGAPTMLDGSGSTDNSGYIAWFNWTFDDGTYYNGTTAKVVHNWSVPGVYVVILNVSDSFGNWDTNIVNITVEDIGPPVTTLTIGFPKYRENIGDYWNVTANASFTPFTLSAIDNWAGVNFSWYTIDNDYFVYSGSPFTLSGYDEGLHNITYGSEDKAGNNETANFILVILDNSAPLVPIDIGSPKYRNNPGDEWNVTETTLFTLLPYDEYSGVDIVTFMNGSGPHVGTIFTLLGNEDGYMGILWTAKDRVGNSMFQSIWVNLDSTPPITDISIGTPRFRAQPTDYWNITTSTELSITHNNDGDGSGINFTWYTIDGVYYEYSSPFTLTPGIHTITWGGEDNLGNNETGNSQIINVDDQPPITNLVIGSPKYRLNLFDNWNVSSETDFTLQSQDLFSGVNYSWYIIGSQYFEGSTFNLSGYADGLYTITWGSIDNVGNNETGFSILVYLDDTPPTTSLTLGDPKYRALASDDWNITSNTEFSLSSSDSRSGVNVTWYTIDGDYYIGILFSLSGYSDGMHTIIWGSKDNVGNNETGNSITVWLDHSAPETTLIIDLPRYPVLPFDGCNVTSSTQINLSGADKPDAHNVGMKFTWFTIDGNYFVYNGMSFNLSSYGEGSHTFSWGSEDNLGNNETGNSILIWVDDSAPKTDINIQQPRYPSSPDDGINVTSTTQIILSGADLPMSHNSGIGFSWYTIDGDYYVGTSFDLFGYGEGLHVIAWGSIDNLDHNETASSITIWVDDSAPVTDLAIGLPRYPLSPYNGCNVTSTTPFSLSGVDMPNSHNASISFTWYTIDGDYYVYSGPSFDLSGYGEGAHIITWGGQDNVRNNETGNSITVWLDDSAPETGLTIGLPRYPLSPYDNGNVTSTTQITLSTVDNPTAHNAGIIFTWYTIDSDYYVGLSFDFSGYGEGSHLITWGSIDNLGNNETGNSITVWVDDSVPVTVLNIDLPRFPLSPYDGCNVTSATMFTLTGEDKPSSHNSGISITWYTIDGNYYEGSSFILLGYSEGPHTIAWGSVDNLGNSELGNSIIIWLDDSAPVTDLTIDLPRYPLFPFDGCNVTSATHFTLLGTDEPMAHNAGISITWYTIDGNYYTGTIFDLSGYGEGSHVITWGSIDKLGHNETGNSMSVWMDDSNPVTSISIGLPRYPSSPYDGCNVTSTTLFTLSGVDKPDAHNSGIKTTWYTIDGDYYEGTTFTLSGYGEGVHTITWGHIDNVDNNETGNNIEVILDDSTPSTTRSIGEPKNRNTGNDHWNITNTTSFTLLPADQYSGVNFTWYTIDGVYFEGLSFDLSGYIEGLHNLTWGSLDNLGWNETGNYEIVNLNYTSPLTAINIVGPKYRGLTSDLWNVTSASIFILTPRYTPSEVDFIWYIIDGEYFEGDTFTLSGYNDGPHSIIWGTRDKLGYNETGNFWMVMLDNAEPNTSIDVGDPKYRNNGNDLWNVTSHTTMTLLSVDQYSGVNYSWHTIDGQYFEGSTFDLQGFGEGLHVISYGSIDNLGNNETSKYISIWVDDSSPEIDLTIGLPRYPLSPYNGCNVTSTTQFTISGMDKPDSHSSGIDFIWYTIDIDYDVGTSFDLFGYGIGSHMITWGGIDNLGNNGTSGTIFVILDTNPPITDLDISIPKYRDGDEDYWNVKDTTPFILTAFDQYAGVYSTWYTVENQYFEAKNFNLAGFEEGLHILNWGSIDNLGNNESGNSIRVYLDKLPPSTEITIGIPKFRANNDDYWNVTDSTTFTLVAYDQYSGVKSTWYMIDGDYFEGNAFDLGGYDDGLHTVTWGSVDNLDNSETANTLRVYLDNTPPLISIEFGTPNRIIDNITHITSSTNITLFPFDSGANTTILYYSLDAGATYSLYNGPFTVPAATKSILYGGEDALGNRADESSIDVVVNNRDNDKDGLYDIEDDDDDNDGLWDSDEDKNRNGIVDKGETDPFNPDTDGDGHNDFEDKYPLDETKWKEPSDWEKLPLVGGYDQSLCINLVIIFVIVLILLIVIPESQPDNGFSSEPSFEPSIESSSDPNNK
jgi:hypothetical protein